MRLVKGFLNDLRVNEYQVYGSDTYTSTNFGNGNKRMDLSSDLISIYLTFLDFYNDEVG
jgi:hypothetical protein